MQSSEKSSISRRTLIAGAGATAAAAVVVAACGDDDDDTTTGGTEAPGGTDAPDATTGDTTGGGEAPGDVKTGGILRVGMVGSTNDIIDGQYIVTKTDQARLVMGWEPLVHYDADFQLSYENALATGIDAEAPDHYVVHLREGVTFHDGKPMTSADVIYSFSRRLDEASDVYSPGLAEFLALDGVTAVDDLTVDIKLLKPAVTFLNTMAEYTQTVVPEGYTRDGDQIGTGPFILESFTPGAESVHKRNPNYWGGGGRPYLDEVQIIDFADSTAMINALKAGEVDCIAEVPYASADAVKGDGVELLVSEGGSWLVITMAIDQAPMDDNRVRQAMRLICDRDAMVNQVIAGYGTVANDLYGKLDGCYSSNGIEQRVQDLDKAKALLEEAGQAGMTIDLFAPDDTAGLAELIAVFAEQAKGAGITVNAEVLDGGTYWGDEYCKRTFATSFWNFRPYLPQAAAGALATATYPETHWPPPGSDFQAKYDEALQTVDEEARCAIIHEMMREEWEEGGNIIPFYNNLVDAYADYVKGLEARKNVLNLDHYGRGFKNVWLDV